MTHLDTSERLAAATPEEETAALAAGAPTGAKNVAGDRAADNAAAGNLPESGPASGDAGGAAALCAGSAETAAGRSPIPTSDNTAPSLEKALPSLDGAGNTQAGGSPAAASEGAKPGNRATSGSAVEHEPAPTENGAAWERGDPDPSQVSSWAVAALRAELSETQRQVEVISDAFAQAVDVIAETLAPAESRIRETVAAALAHESAAVRQALAAEWSERAGRVDQRVADQLAMLATAMESWRKELTAQLAQQIRSLHPSSETGSDHPARPAGEAPPVERVAAPETNEAYPWLAQLEAQIKASIQQEVAAALGPHLTELTERIRDLAPGAWPQPDDLTSVVERWEALIQSLTAQPPSAVTGPAASPDRKTEILEKLDDLQNQFSQDLGSLEAQLVSAINAQLAPAMEAQLASGFEIRLRDHLTQQHASLEARLQQRIEEVTERLRADLEPPTPPVPGGSAAVEVEVVANAVKTIAAELTDLRQQLCVLASRPAPAVDGNCLAQPLSAAFEKLDQTVGERLNALFDAMREELSSHQDARTRAIRRELDRVLYIATGLFGLLGGGFLWLLLRSS